ncbi:MAG: Cytochrome bd terminal oxidase subunit II, partial [uncultured Pseudonocardia sp.]
GPRRALVLAARPDLHPVLLPRGLRLRRRHAAPAAGPHRGRGAGADRHDRAVLGRQRGVGARRRRGHVLDVPDLVRRAVQRHVPALRDHPAGPAAARGVLRVPQPGRPAALARLLGLDVLHRQRHPRVPLGPDHGEDHRGAPPQRPGGRRGRDRRAVHAVLAGGRHGHAAAVRAARRELPAAAPAHRHRAAHAGAHRGAAVGRARHRRDPRLRRHGLRHRGPVRQLRRAALAVPARRRGDAREHLAGADAQARRARLRDERADDRVLHGDDLHLAVPAPGRAAVHAGPGAEPDVARLGEPALHTGADDLGRRDLPAADHRLPDLELLRVPRAHPARRGQPGQGLL